MVFPSVPVYQDPPINWRQQEHQPDAGGDVYQHPQPAPAGGGHLSATGGSVRPGSMAERARLAKIPQPESALKCPRCDSTNTKFCYFNNYSLSQPRHFCKACRRYWTSGGALRNVPVGGGCRRNKRSKSSSAAAAAGSASSSKSQAALPASVSFTTALPSFMAPWHQLPEYAGEPNTGLSFSEYSVDQWRIQQIQQLPFLGGLVASTSLPAGDPVVPGLYTFEGGTATVSGGPSMATQYANHLWGTDDGGSSSRSGGGGVAASGATGWLTDISGAFNS